MEFTFLGTGTSTGVPRIGCPCAVCATSQRGMKNHRLRCSALIRHEGRTILIDTGPDFREQMLTHKVDRIDAVLFTHSHFDHVAGLPEIRSYNFVQKQVIPCYGKAEELKEIKKTWHFMFGKNTSVGGGIGQVELHAVSKPFDLYGLTITPLLVDHGTIQIYGYRINDLAYIPDCNGLPQETRLKLANLEVLALDALQYRRHVSHFSLQESLDIVKELQPAQAYFIHLGCALDHEKVVLPPSVALAHDGLTLTLPWPDRNV